jgi:hypothetical protein
VTTQKENKIYVHVLNWNAPLLALPPIDKVSGALSMLDGASVEFTQNSDGIVLKIPQARADETDRVVVLTVKKGNQ